MSEFALTGRAPTSHRIAVNGLGQRYLEWGDPDAPAVVMLHGLRSYAYTWDPIARVLADRYRLVAPDFRGRGESDWDPQRDYYTDTYVADVEALVAHLGLTRFALIGHSMGGTVAYAYAARHPELVAATVVEDIGPGSSTDTAGADRILHEMAATPPAFASLAEVYAYWRRIRPEVTDDALASRVEHTVRPGASGGWEWRLDMGGIADARQRGDPARSIDLWCCVEGLRSPTLVVRGGRSDFLPVVTCQEMAQRQPRLRWQELTGAGHYVHDDAPEEFVHAVRQFLREAVW